MSYPPDSCTWDLRVSLRQVLPSTICLCLQQYVQEKTKGNSSHTPPLQGCHRCCPWQPPWTVCARCPRTTIPHHCLPSHTWASATGVTYSCINTTALQLQSSSSDVISPFHLHVLPSLSNWVAIPIICDSVLLSLFWEHSPTLLPSSRPLARVPVHPELSHLLVYCNHSGLYC